MVNLSSLKVGFPGGIGGKEPAGDTGDVCSFLGREDPLEKRTATYSSILAWRIPWTEEPGGYSLWGCKDSDTTEHTAHTQSKSYLLIR